MIALLRHEITYYFRSKGELIELLCFILMVCLLLPFGWPQLLHQGAAGEIAMLWIAMLAGSALSAAGLFNRDLESGAVELYQIAPLGLDRIVFTKWAAFYIALLVPLLLAIPIIGLWFQIPAALWGVMALGVAVGAAGASTIQTLSAGLLAGQGRGTAFLGLLSLPLMIPLMIFGTAYCRQTELADPHLWFLIGIWLLMLPITCGAVAASLRASN